VAFSATDGDGSIASASQRVQVLTDFNLLPDSDADGISNAFESLHGAVDPANDTDVDDVEVIYVPEAALAAQLLAGILGLRILYRRRQP
jgi:hypothetical protein